jgi:hypothetical protein
VGRVSETPFTFEYGAAARLVRGVYLPVTLTVEDRITSLVIMPFGYSYTPREAF